MEIIQHQALTQMPIHMATWEIAELTNKRHDNVLRDVRRMLKEYNSKLGPDVKHHRALGGGLLTSEETPRRTQLGGHPGGPPLTAEESTYTDVQGKQMPCLLLPPREVMILITGYSVPLRAAVIDRLAELEKVVQAQAQPMLAPPPAILEPPDDLFPITPVERFASTALAQFKSFGTSIRNAVWQSKEAVSQKIDAAEQESHKRDQYIARQNVEGQKDVRALRDDVNEIYRYLTREPDWITMSQLLREKNIDAGGLKSLLSKEAEAWFTARSKRLQIASPQSNLRATWFERGYLIRWWKEDGERIYENCLKRRKGTVLVSIDGGKGKGDVPF